VAVSVIV